MASPKPESPGSRLLLWAQVFFFFSGAAGLVYQVLWTRRLTLTFGHTVLAVSTVLTAFMGGLALGSLAAGHWTDSRPCRRPVSAFLADYGYLEGFIGGWALLSLVLLNLVDDLYIRLASSGIEGAVLHLACFAAAAVVLVPPTAAMGATVPILSRMLVQTRQELGSVLSRLYGLNTLGALTGAALGGFWLLPRLGLNQAMGFTALVNMLIAVAAVAKARRSQAGKETPDPDPASETAQARDWLIPLTFGAAGAASMAFQVGWNRTLCLVIGSSVYAFSIILVCFLGGLGLGSLLYGRLMKGRVPKVLHLSLLYLGIAFGGLITVVAIPALPDLFFQAFPYVKESFLKVLLLDLVLVGGLLFLPTLAMGLGFPMATAIYSHSENRVGRSVGEVYGANTVGCIVGAFCSGFLLVPAIGAQGTLQLACAVYLVASVALLGEVENRYFKPLTAVATLILVTGAALPRWDQGTMAWGVAVYSDVRAEAQVQNARRRPLVFLDGLSSTVTFHIKGENFDDPHMRVNGKTDASRGQGDRLTQYFLGYLPGFLHSQPRRAAVIGLGGGFTVEAVAQFRSIEEVHVAELEPAVVEINRFWAPYNGHILEDPRVKVHVQDGRTFILAAQGKFDLIISEPSNPWIAGIGNLFTRDFYAHARERLEPGGVMCQWFNLYAVSTEDTRMVLRSFFDVFPEGSVWQSSGGDLVLIGSEKPIPFDLDRVRQIWAQSPTIQRHFFESKLFYPEALPGHFLMTRVQALELVGEGPLNTDDRPLLEFSAPLSLYREDALSENIGFLWGGTPPSLPPGVKPSPEVLDRALFGAVNRNQLDLVEAGLSRSGMTRPEHFVLAARVAQSRNQDPTTEKAETLLRSGAKAFPEEAELLLSTLAELHYRRQDYLEAVEVGQRALSAPPPGSKPWLLRLKGQALVHLDRDREALPGLLESAVLTPHESTALAVAGGALIKLRKPEQALEVLDEALRRNPLDLVAMQNRAYALFNLGKPRAAETQLLQFLELYPSYGAAWRKLGQFRLRLGRQDSAAQAFRRALQLNPDDQEAVDGLSLSSRRHSGPGSP